MSEDTLCQLTIYFQGEDEPITFIATRIDILRFYSALTNTNDDTESPNLGEVPVPNKRIDRLYAEDFQGNTILTSTAALIGQKSSILRDIFDMKMSFEPFTSKGEP